jgi:hypothetical protein
LSLVVVQVVTGLLEGEEQADTLQPMEVVFYQQ